MRNIETRYEIQNDNETIVLSASSREEAIEQAKEQGFAYDLYEVTYPVIFRINAVGIKDIAQFLKEKHKQGEQIATEMSFVEAWATDAENSIYNNGCAQFEIPSANTTTGCPEVCYLDIEEHFCSELSEYEIDSEEIEIYFERFDGSKIEGRKFEEELFDTVMFDATKNGAEETARFWKNPQDFVFSEADGLLLEPVPHRIVSCVTNRAIEEFNKGN